MKNPQRICYVAGKSGGHIIPCLTLAHEEKQNNPLSKILFFSTDGALDRSIISASHDITTHVTLPLQKSSFSGTFSFIAFTYNFFISVCKLFYYLIKMRPDKMISTGGFIAVPAVLCARLLAIPVELYELNVKPGKAIRFLSSRSVTLKICFAQTQRYFPHKKCVKASYPIRFFDDCRQMSQKEALEELNLDTSRKTITVLGGSQGSLEINNLLHEFILEHPDLATSIQIIHQTGTSDGFNWQEFYAKQGITAHVFSFCTDLAPHYAAADLVICRSGAGTLFEVLFFGKPCITVPLITEKNNHQLQNALAMQDEYDDLFRAFISNPKKNNLYKDELFKHITKNLNVCKNNRTSNQGFINNSISDLQN